MRRSNIPSFIQISRRALRYFLPLRCQGDWLRKRRRTGRAAERIPPLLDAGRSRDPRSEDTEAGDGGEVGCEECAAGKRDEGEGLPHLQ